MKIVTNLRAHRGRVLRPLLDRMRYALLLWLGVAALLTLFDVTGNLGSADGEGLPLTAILSEFASFLLKYGPVVWTMSLAVAYAPARPWARYGTLAVCLLLSCAVGTLLDFRIAELVAPWELGVQPDHDWAGFFIDMTSSLMPAALTTAVYEFYRRGLDADEEAQRLRAARATLMSELSRARLQALRAQVEPHFLFNTLANLRRLYRTDAAAGRSMMQQLIDYLRIALPSLQRERISLREEALLIAAYLDLHRVRMGERLRYDIAFPPFLLDQTVPPMMLLTLVENAIKHGLAPLPEGGVVRIGAERFDDCIELDVSDSGRGISEGSGPGSGLANLRARLTALYGERASLRVISNRPRGVSAILRLPMIAGVVA